MQVLLSLVWEQRVHGPKTKKRSFFLKKPVRRRTQSSTKKRWDGQTKRCKKTLPTVLQPCCGQTSIRFWGRRIPRMRRIKTLLKGTKRVTWPCCVGDSWPTRTNNFAARIPFFKRASNANGRARPSAKWRSACSLCLPLPQKRSKTHCRTPFLTWATPSTEWN